MEIGTAPFGDAGSNHASEIPIGKQKSGISSLLAVELPAEYSMRRGEDYWSK